jgi:hypothetical protein
MDSLVKRVERLYVMAPPIMPSCCLLDMIISHWGSVAISHFHGCFETVERHIPDMVTHAHGGLWGEQGGQRS